MSNGAVKLFRRRAYWAKKVAGKLVVYYPLPEPDAKTPLQVTISPAPPPAQPSKAQTELQQQLERARVDHAERAVPARLVRPHPIIAGWLLAEFEARPQHEDVTIGGLFASGWLTGRPPLGGPG